MPHGRSFKAALGNSLFREQYLDAVACIINVQEAAGLESYRTATVFDLAVGGTSWFFSPIERLGGIAGDCCDTSRCWMQRHNLRAGHILWEVQEAHQPAVVTEAPDPRRTPLALPPSGR